MPLRLPSIACGPLPEFVDLRISSKIIQGQEVYSVIQESRLWPNKSDITVSFFGGTWAQKAVVKGAFTEYALYANINFIIIEDNSTEAKIRIAFFSPKAWSAIGRQALKMVGRPTMDLGSIDKTNPSDVDRAIALHEVGHALGLEHEWDGRNTHFASFGGNEAIVQHAHHYSGKAVSNFPRLDNKSAMTYFLPAGFTKNGNGIPGNSELSDADKAWLVINYSGRYAVSNGVSWNLLQALDTLNIPPAIASRILSSKNISNRRAYYFGFISSIWGKNTALGDETKKKISHELSSFHHHQPPSRNYVVPDADTGADGTNTGADGTDPSSTTGTNDLSNIFASVILHPSFRETVRKLAEDDLPSHGIILSQYPIQNAASTTTGSQEGLVTLLLPILTQLMSNADEAAASQYRNPGAAYYPGKPLSPEIQRGIFDVFTSVIKNPIFINVVKDIITAAATAAAAA